MLKLILEAVVVGLVFAVLGTAVSYVASKYMKVDLPPVCDNWNKNKVMEISLFLTGFLGHIFFEAIGANKWYCFNGYACSR